MTNYTFDDDHLFKRGSNKELDAMFTTSDIKVVVVDVQKDGPAEKAGIHK
jgi:hypothetical protein